MLLKKIRPHTNFKRSDYKNHKSDLTHGIKKEVAVVKKYRSKIDYRNTKMYN